MNDLHEIETLIRSLEEQRYRAITEGDFESFGALAHPDLRYTHSNGVVDTLQSYLDKCLNGYYVYHRIEHPIDSINVMGDLALVFGEMNGEITAGGVNKTLKNRALAVWACTGGSWKLLAYQPTPVR